MKVKLKIRKVFLYTENTLIGRYFRSSFNTNYIYKIVRKAPDDVLILDYYDKSEKNLKRAKPLGTTETILSKSISCFEAGTYKEIFP